MSPSGARSVQAQCQDACRLGPSSNGSEVITFPVGTQRLVHCHVARYVYQMTFH